MKKTRILIIDDDPGIQFTISEICTYCGYDATAVSSGREGFERIQAQHFDLVILDYNMPDWDGLLTTKKIKAYAPNLPILILTVDEQQQTADKFMAAGANDFSIKPVKAPDLISRIKVNLHIGEMQRKMQQKKQAVYIEKGISLATMQLITDFLSKQDNEVTFEDISNGVELAYQTVHRYIKYLENNSLIEVVPVYGNLGRPKNTYKLIEGFDIHNI
jgi:two-component system response regulator DctR